MVRTHTWVAGPARLLLRRWLGCRGMDLSSLTPMVPAGLRRSTARRRRRRRTRLCAIARSGSESWCDNWKSCASNSSKWNVCRQGSTRRLLVAAGVTRSQEARKPKLSFLVDDGGEEEVGLPWRAPLDDTWRTWRTSLLAMRRVELARAA